MCDFFVGQKVVCVEGRDYWRERSIIDRIRSFLAGATTPMKGVIYTITGFQTETGHSWPLGLYLDGLNPEWFFSASGFRPLVSTRNDISELQALLGPSRLATVD